jgi:uncharacterized protein YjiS (DUF1127 family)
MERVLFASLKRHPSRAGFLRRLLGAMSLRRSRHRLGELDEHLLEDLGLHRERATREARRGSWDVPDHWMR